MDGTFKTCPKNFYQIYNIFGKEKNSNNIIPLMYILMSHKSYTLYFVIFNYIKTLLVSYNIQVDFDDISFMLDFEKSFRKA